MSVLILAAMMMAQAPAAAQPEKPVTVNKTKQICEMIEVTGSRARKRVCRDANGKLDLGPGVHNNVDTRGTLTQQPVGHVGGPGR